MEKSVKTKNQPVSNLRPRASLPRGVSFTRPAEPGVTYHVQASTNLTTWSDIVSYAGSNVVLTTQAQEISRTGTPNESVTVRDVTGMNNKTARFLRVIVTRP